MLVDALQEVANISLEYSFIFLNNGSLWGGWKFAKMAIGLKWDHRFYPEYYHELCINYAFTLSHGSAYETRRM